MPSQIDTNDPFLILLTDALRAGPGSPQWHEAVSQLKLAGENVDEYKLLIEARESLFFRSGSAEVPPGTVKLLSLIAGQLGRLPNPIAIEGHTDSVPYQLRAGYSNWELSADRANAARRAMEATGLRRHQVVEVRGYADSKPRDPKHPASPINRRVSILVNLVDAPASDKKTSGDDSARSRQPISLGIQPLE